MTQTRESDHKHVGNMLTDRGSEKYGKVTKGQFSYRSLYNQFFLKVQKATLHVRPK